MLNLSTLSQLPILSRISALTWPQLILLASSLLFTYIVLQILYNISPLHPLSAYPGPSLWRATRISWITALHLGHIHNDLHTFHARYGPVVRIAPNELSYIDARAWKDIYGGRQSRALGDKTVFERNHVWFRNVRRGQPMSLMSHDEARHAVQRKALMSAFSDKAVGEQTGIVEGMVGLWIEQLRKKCEGKLERRDETVTEKQQEVAGLGVVDLVEWFNFLVFDISGLLTYGEDFGSTRSGKPHPWVKVSALFGKGMALMASLNFFGNLGVAIAFVLVLIMPRSARSSFTEFLAMSRRLAVEKIKGKNRGRRADFLDAMLKFNESGKDDKVSEAEMQITSTIVVFAASETTATSLSGMLTFLVKPENRSVLDKVMSEVRTRFASESDIKITSVADLPYLNAVICEGLRLSPPVALSVPRVSPKDGAMVAGRFVPGGTLVSVNQFPANRSPTNFTNPSSFEPERFIEPREGDNMDVLNPFSIGRHQCLGMRLAWAEMRLVLARLFYAFDLEAVDASKVGDWADLQTFVFWEKVPLQVRLRARSR